MTSLPMHMLIPVLLLAGCIDRFETPAAYQSQRYLCAPENAASFMALVAECLDDRAAGGDCGGVLSFRGQLDGLPVIVESRLGSSRFETRLGALGRVDLSGASPYYHFNMKLDSIGGLLEPPITTERSLTLEPGAGELTLDLTDTLTDGSLQLSAGGRSLALPFLSGGTVTVEQQSRTELHGRFQLTAGSPEDAIEGCFQAFPTGGIVEQGS